MLERKHIGRDERVGPRQPALVIGRPDSRKRSGRNRASARRAASRAGSCRRTSTARLAAAVLGGDRLGHGRDSRVRPAGQARPRPGRAEFRATSRASGGDADERQRLRRAQQDRLAEAGAEGLAIEDDLAGVALDRDFVGFLDMDAVELGPAQARPTRLAKKARSMETGFCSTATNLSGPPPADPTSLGQQQLFEGRDEQEGEAAGDRALAAHLTLSMRRLGRQEAGAEPKHLPQARPPRR